LTTVLVFTRNFAIRQAITSLSAKDRQVYFFDNRLEFLVCATVFDKPCVLIDTLHECGETIRWIYSRLSARGGIKNIYFIAPEEIAENNYLKLFWLVTTIKELHQVCDQASRHPVVGKSYGLKEALCHQLSVMLSKDHMRFLKAVYDPINSHYVCENKSDINKMLYLRKRLSLGTSLEMKQLIALLTSSPF